MCAYSGVRRLKFITLEYLLPGWGWPRGSRTSQHPRRSLSRWIYFYLHARRLSYLLRFLLLELLPAPGLFVSQEK
jgi:hypothetical protein